MSAEVSKGRVRYSVDLPIQVDQQLEALAKERGVKKSELLRAAIKLFAELHRFDTSGYSVGGWKFEGNGQHFVHIILP